MTEKKRNRDIVIEGNPQPETPTEMRLKQRNAYTPLGQRVPIDPSDNIDHMDIKVDTSLVGSVIHQKDSLSDTVERLMDLREKGIRDALVKAGWTPPMKCAKCTADLAVVPADEPWHDEYLICKACDSTYFKDEIKGKEADYQEKLKATLDRIDDADKYTPGQVVLMKQAADKMLADGMKEPVCTEQCLLNDGTCNECPEVNPLHLLSKSLRAICLMRDYCPTEMPAKEGWEWFDVGSDIAKAIPHDEWAREFRERVKIDQDNRAIADSLRNYLFSANAYAKCDVPMFNVVPGFLDKMGFSQHEQDRLVKVNAIRIEESILTDKDQAKLFDEYQIPDKDEYAKSCANKLANMTDSERSEYLNGSFEPVQAGLDSDKLIQPQDFPEDFDLENGQYWHNCECGLTFTGHKRRGNLCKICTQKDAKVE